MSRLTRHLERSRQRPDERGPAHELNHQSCPEPFRDFAGFSHVVYTTIVIVSPISLSRAARADQAIDAQLRHHLAL